MTMGKVIRCDTCELGFPSIGSLKSEARMKQHKKTPHKIACGECKLMFISTTHLRFHLLFTHDGRCSYCFRFCEGKCSRIYGVAIETAGKEAMKAMELDKNSTIEELEATLEKMVGKITVDNVEIVQKYANCVDAGYEGHETDAWNMLIYYPSPERTHERLPPLVDSYGFIRGKFGQDNNRFTRNENSKM